MFHQESREHHTEGISPWGGKQVKGEQNQPIHLIIQIILFSCYLTFALIIHRGDYALPIHGRNRWVFSSLTAPFSLFGLTFPL